MDADLLWFNPVFIEPVAVKRGVVGRILHGVPNPFIDEGIEIAPSQCLNIGRKVVTGRHTRGLLEELLISYCVPIGICATSDTQR